MTYPTLDVIVTHYNLHAYLDAAVQSALDQEGVSPNVIVVDDASDTAPQFGDWPRDRVRLIRRKRRGGQGAAINTGLQASTADVVAFLDSDDLLPAHRSRVLMDALAQDAADLAYGGQVVFNDGSFPELRASEQQRQGVAKVLPGLLPGTILMTRGLADRLGRIDETLLFGAVMEWLDRLGSLQPAARQLALSEVVLLRRSHAHNTSRTHRDEVVAAYLDLVAQHRARGRS